MTPNLWMFGFIELKTQEILTLLSPSQWQRSSIHDSNNFATQLQTTIPVFTDFALSIPTFQPKSPTLLSQWHPCRSMNILYMLQFTLPLSSPRNVLEFPLAGPLTFLLIFQGLFQIPSYLRILLVFLSIVISLYSLAILSFLYSPTIFSPLLHDCSLISFLVL